MSSSIENSNTLNIISRLEAQKKDYESYIDQIQFKSMTLKRRKELVGSELAEVRKQLSDKESLLDSIKNRVDLQQNSFNQQQMILERHQMSLKQISRQTQEQANKRYALIGEFEDEMMKLSEQVLEQNLCATLNSVDLNINKSVMRDKEVSQNLVQARARVSELLEMKQQLTTAAGGNLADLLDRCKIMIRDLQSDDVEEDNVGEEQDDQQMMMKEKSEMAPKIASKL